MLPLRLQRYLLSSGKEGGSANSIKLWKARIRSAELGWRLFSFHSDTYLPLHIITVCKFSSSYPGANDCRWLDKVMGDKKHPYLPGWAPERLKDSGRKTSSKSKQTTSFSDPTPSRSKKLHLSKRQKIGLLIILCGRQLEEIIFYPFIWNPCLVWPIIWNKLHFNDLHFTANKISPTKPQAKCVK